MIRHGIKARLTAACATLAIAIAGAAPPVIAQESAETESYILRFAREVADGRAVVSTSHDTIVARGRIGDRSIMLHDIQAGAVTIERAEGTGALALTSERRIDASHAYDYSERRLSGTGPAVAVFNQFLRPLISQGPALGQDAAWTVATGLDGLGLPGDDPAPLTISLNRTYLTNAGQAVVLVEFEIRAFTYYTPDGDPAVHWARGFAVSDPSFSQIHALGTQHRATVTQADGRVLPISVRTSLHGIDSAGGWRMSFADAPKIRAAVERTLATAGDQVHATTSEAEAAPISPYPAMVAARLDLAALAIGENGANPMPTTLDAAVAPAPDSSAGLGFAGGGPLGNPSSFPTTTSSSPEGANERAERIAGEEAVEADPYGLRPPANGEPSQTTTVVKRVRVRRDNGEAEGAAESGDSGELTRSDAGASSLVRASVLQQNSGAPGDEAEVSVRNQMLQGLNQYIENDYSMMQLNPDDTALTYRTAETRDLGETIGSMVETASERERRLASEEAAESAPLGAENAAGDTVLKRVRVRRDNGESDASVPPAPAATTDPSIRREMLNGLNSYIQNDYEMMDLNPDDQAFTYRTSEARNLGDTIGRMTDSPNAQESGDAANRLDPEAFGRQKSLLRSLTDADDSSVAAGSETERLDSYIAEMARAADAEAQRDNSTRMTPLEQSDEGYPPWFDGERERNPRTREADDTLYRLALAELEREEAEARRDERRERQRAESGIDSLDEFVRNNAFDYTSMVGIVPTDLSRWGEWLATQNVRELERLARLIGYPNLASALADARNLIRFAEDAGYRRWSMQAPSCNGLGGCGPSYLERWWQKQATVLLGGILADSRDIFSTGGFSDIGISGSNLSYLLRDNALEDGDIVNVKITQFGRVLFEGQTTLTNVGEQFGHQLRQGVAALEIFAVNEGFSSPNTAEIALDNVVRGNATQSYSLLTGETATLRIETNARGQ